VDIKPANNNERNYYYYRYFNNDNKSRVRDADVPLMFKLASKTLPDPTALPRDNAPQPDQNELADQQMAQYIADNLKANELATGQEVSSSDIEGTIRDKFPGVNDNIIKLATDMIINDAESMKSRVAGNHTGFKLLVSARSPAFGKQTTTSTSTTTTNQNRQPPMKQSQPTAQQQQQPQQRQPSQQQLQQKSASVENYRDMTWKKLRSLILSSPVV